jgi:glycine/serine hydroxymethyltransferase
MDRIAAIVHQAFRQPDNSDLLGQLCAEVREICEAFPLYSELDGIS